MTTWASESSEKFAGRLTQPCSLKPPRWASALPTARTWVALKPFGFFDRHLPLDVRAGITGHGGP